MKHASLGASSSGRWLECPGSPRLCAQAPPQPLSPYAAEGTAAHALAEKCLTEAWDAAQFIGDPVADAPRVTAEMAGAVQVYLDVVRGDRAALSALTELKIETRFDLAGLGRPDMYGTVDAMLLEPFGILRVFDYKHGVGVVVDAKDNPQMMYYALGALTAAGADVYEEVELVVVQPRATTADGPVRRHRLSVSDLERWGREVLVPGAIATESENAPLAAGKHCRFCPARPICPEQQKTALEVATAAFSPAPATLPAPSALSTADLQAVLDKAEIVEGWFEAVRVHVRHGLETGTIKAEDIGHKLVAGRATRTWANEEAAETWLKAVLGDDAYAPRKILTPAQAEMNLKGEAKTAVKSKVSVVRGTQLVPLADKRPAITPALTAFSNACAVVADMVKISKTGTAS